MWNRRYILDKANVKTCRLKSTQCGFSTRTWALDIYFYTSETMFLCFLDTIL